MREQIKIKVCEFCNNKLTTNDESYLIDDSFIRTNSIYVPLVEVIRETIGFSDEVSCGRSY